MFEIKLENEPFEKDIIQQFRNDFKESSNFSESELDFFIVKGAVSNAAYVAKGGSINILRKSGELIDVAQASDLPNIKAMSKIVKKYYLCFPKGLRIKN
ncbi:MAG: hypothetical protein RIA69_06315 [Cyclobacteriaceae bacterium]